GAPKANLNGSRRVLERPDQLTGGPAAPKADRNEMLRLLERPPSSQEWRRLLFGRTGRFAGSVVPVTAGAGRVLTTQSAPAGRRLLGQAGGPGGVAVGPAGRAVVRQGPVEGGGVVEPGRRGLEPLLVGDAVEHHRLVAQRLDQWRVEHLVDPPAGDLGGNRRG